MKVRNRRMTTCFRDERSLAKTPSRKSVSSQHLSGIVDWPLLMHPGLAKFRTILDSKFRLLSSAFLSFVPPASLREALRAGHALAAYCHSAITVLPPWDEDSHHQGPGRSFRRNLRR